MPEHNCWMVFLAYSLIAYAFFAPTFQPGNKADTSKTAAQVVKGERNQIEDKLNQEQLQSLRLKQELANVERRNTELTKASYITLTKLHRKCQFINIVSEGKCRHGNCDCIPMNGMLHYIGKDQLGSKRKYPI